MQNNSKQIWKKWLLTVVMALVMLPAFSSFSRKGDVQDLDGRWVVSVLPGVDLSKSRTMTIDLETRKRHLSAAAVCNRISGECRINTKDKSISFRRLSMTWKACDQPDIEHQLLQGLQLVTHYRREAHHLYLLQGERQVMVLVRTR